MNIFLKALVIATALIGPSNMNALEAAYVGRAFACNEKVGVSPTKCMDTFACDEPVNVFAPVILWETYAQKPHKSKVMLLGLEHRYEKVDGLNTCIHFSMMKQNTGEHYQFHVESKYKFRTEYNVSVFPIAKLSWAKFGTKTYENETKAYLWKNCLHLGLGIEQSYQNLLLLGLHASIVNDLDNRSFGEFGDTFMGVNNLKSLSYRVHPYFHFSLFGKGVLEIEPHYGKCFKDKFQEFGCKVSYAIVF